MSALVRRMTLAAALAGALSACGSDPTGVTDPVDVQGTTWRLSMLERADDRNVRVSAPDRYTLVFDDASRVSIRSDCNQCAGTFRIENGTFAVGPLACTKAYCGDQSLDSEYVGFLSEATSLALEGDRLIVRSRRGTLRYER